jgi:hypothetical protein
MMSWTLAGCYTFRPVDPFEAIPGEEIRLVLNESALPGLAPSALLGETSVQGDLVGVSDDSISVSIWIGQAYRGTPFEAAHQDYAFPRTEVIRLERRRLSRTRTALTTVGVLAGIYILIDRLDFLEDPNPDFDDDDPEPPDIPLLSWSWRFPGTP